MVLVGWFSVDHHFTVVKRWLGRIQLEIDANLEKTHAKTGSEKGMRN